MAARRPLAEIWAGPLPVVGMVHLPPLPGAPGWGGSMRAVVERAVADAGVLEAGGVDGVLVENYRDAPFHPSSVPPETIAAMAAVAARVVDAVELPIGVNVLRNDAAAALGVATAAGARFIRVNVHTGVMMGDQGWLVGRAHETIRSRQRLGSPVAILADVLVKHAAAPAPLDVSQAARDTWHRGLADGLVVSGPETGAAADASRLEEVAEAAPEAPVWVGSGLTPDNAAALLARADGAIVGSALQRGGRAGAGVVPARVRRLVAAVDEVRESRRQGRAGAEARDSRTREDAAESTE